MRELSSEQLASSLQCMLYQHLKFAVDFTDDAHGFVGALLLHDFGATVGALFQAEAEKNRIRHLD